MTESLDLVGVKVGRNNFPIKPNLDQSGLYNFYLVIDDLVQLDQDYELPDGKKITTLLRASYYDAVGDVQQLYLPYYTYDPVNLRHFNFGEAGKANEFKSLEELLDLVENNREAVKEGRGIMIFHQFSSVKSGQIRLIGFGMQANPLLDDGSRKFFQDTVSVLYDATILKGFAQTGDPNHLPQVPGYGALLIPLNDGDGDVSKILEQRQAHGE